MPKRIGNPARVGGIWDEYKAIGCSVLAQLDSDRGTAMTARTDDAAFSGLASTPVLSGWSARVTGGFAMRGDNGAQLDLGGEYGGIGGDTKIWTWRARGKLPF